MTPAPRSVTIAHAPAMNPQLRYPFSRRRFLRNPAFAAAPLIVPGRGLGRDGGVAPSNRIRFGVIGIGPRARDTMPTFLSFPETSWAAVSDCRADCLRHAARPLPGDALARLRAAVDGLDATEDAGALARVLRPDG